MSLPGTIRAGNSAFEDAWIRWRLRFDTAVQRLIAGPHWKARALFVILALTLFRAFPSYDALRWPYTKATWHNVQPLFDHPLADPTQFPESRSDARLVNLTFRRTVPVLAHVFHLGQTGLLMVFGLSGVVMLYEVLRIGYDASGSRVTAVFVCMATACVWPGEAAFHDIRGGYFDAVALCLLVLAISRSSAAVGGICVFLAAWTDERALIASAFVYLYAILRSNRTGFRRLVYGKPGGVCVAWAAYFVTRAIFARMLALKTTSGGVGLASFVDQFNVVPLGIWTGLGGLWIVVACGAAVVLLERRYVFALCYCGVLAAMVLSALAITDVTRTMSYCFPAVFAALLLLTRSVRSEVVERLAITAGVLSFVVPTYYIQGSTGVWWIYPLPVHVVRWISLAR